MGRTGAYTMLQDATGEPGVKITDPDAFDDFLDEHNIESIENWEYADETEYPRIEHRVLYGFCPSRIEDDYKFFIKNVHVKRHGPSGNQFCEFWESVSECCEPFSFRHAGADNHFPDISEAYERAGTSMEMYQIESDGAGGIDINKCEFVAEPASSEDVL